MPNGGSTMTMELLTKAQLQIINRRSKFRQTISQESILRNWEIAKQEKDEGVDLIVYTKDMPNKEILNTIKRIGPFKIDKP